MFSALGSEPEDLVASESPGADEHASVDRQRTKGPRSQGKCDVDTGRTSLCAVEQKDDVVHVNPENGYGPARGALLPCVPSVSQCQYDKFPLKNLV